MGYKLTIKALIFTSILLVLSCIGTIIVYATESGGTTQTLQVVLNDLEEQEVDKVVTLPDKAVITNVSVDTGEVTYEKSGNSVTLHLNSGTPIDNPTYSWEYEAEASETRDWGKKYLYTPPYTKIMGHGESFRGTGGYSGWLYLDSRCDFTHGDGIAVSYGGIYKGIIHKGEEYEHHHYSYDYTVTIDYIVDTVPPQLEVSYDNSPTNQNVILSVSANDNESGVKEIILPDGSIVSELPATYEVSENGEYTFSVTDNAGNTATKTITVSCIDKTAPQFDVTYDESPTNENITLSVSASDEESGINEITLPDGSIVSELPATYEVSENSDYTFSVTDNAGNTATKTVTISCIDKTAPTLEVTYDNNPTNKNITFSVFTSDNESGISAIILPDGSINYSSSTQFEVSENGDYTFTVTDKAGNITTKTVTILNIDKTVPQLEINYDNNPINENIIISVSASDEDSGVNEITLPDGSIVSELPATYEVSANGDYTFTAIDNAGNITTKTVTILNIDKDLPIISSHKIDYKENKILVALETEEENLQYLINENEDIQDLEFEVENILELSCDGTYFAFAKDNAGNISLPYEIKVAPKPKEPQTDNPPKIIVPEPEETQEVITTEPIETEITETEEPPLETQPIHTEISTPDITPPEVIFPTVTENIEEEKQPKEIPVLVIGNEDKNFTLYESDIEGIETIQILDDTGNEIAEFEPENIEKIKVNPPKKDGYDFVGYEKTHLEKHLVLTPTYKASPGYDGMETFEISPSPMPESVVNISNLDNQSTLLRGLIYTIAILAIIVLILSIIALTYKISNLRAERNSR